MGHVFCPISNDLGAVRHPGLSESRLFEIERKRQAPSEDGDGVPHPNQQGQWFTLVRVDGKGGIRLERKPAFAIERSEMSVKDELRAMR